MLAPQALELEVSIFDNLGLRWVEKDPCDKVSSPVVTDSTHLHLRDVALVERGRCNASGLRRTVFQSRKGLCGNAPTNNSQQEYSSNTEFFQATHVHWPGTYMCAVNSASVRARAARTYKYPRGVWYDNNVHRALKQGAPSSYSPPAKNLSHHLYWRSCRGRVSHPEKEKYAEQ